MSLSALSAFPPSRRTLVIVRRIMLPPRGHFILLVDIVETIPNRFEPLPLPLAAIFVWSIICEAFSQTIFTSSHLSVASTSWASTSGMGVARACLLSACKSARRTRGFCGNLCEIAGTLLHPPLMQALYPILQHFITRQPPRNIRHLPFHCLLCSLISNNILHIIILSSKILLGAGLSKHFLLNSNTYSHVTGTR